MNYILEGLDCAHCAAKIERELNKIEGLEPVSVNFAAKSLHLDPAFAPAAQKVIDRIEPGVKLIPQSQGEGEPGGDGRKGWQEYLSSFRILAAGVLFLIGLIFQKALAATSYRLGEYGVFLAAYILAGGPVLAAAFRNIGRGQIFDENFLMSFATFGAIAIDQLPEAVGVMLFYAVGEFFQDLAVHRSRRSIAALLDLRPSYANLIVGDSSRRVAPEAVAVGQIIEVRPGERLPLDGEVVSGSSFVDTSALTGEPVPRRVEAGDGVLAGFINGSGLLRIRVTKSYSESSVARILNLVENAAARKAPTEKFITAFAGWYTPLVVFGAVAVALLPPLIIPGATFSQWIYRALILLVISCPCALVVSIPLGYFGGIGGASRSGILVKGANFLDALTHLDTVVIDKTGTLTKGVFKVTEIIPQNGFTAQEVLEWAALAEAYSTHPIARSILEAFGDKVDNGLIEDYQEIRGHGLKVRMKDGRTILAGNGRLLQQEGIVHQQQEQKGTVVYVAVDGVLAGHLVIADELKEGVAETVAALRKLGVKRLIMVTGDNEHTAARLAAQLDLDGYYAGQLPEGKVRQVEELMAKSAGRGKLAFVGDGINDAPVITRADVGVAMGGLGSDAAIEAADVVLMDDNPRKLVQAIAIARHTRKIVKQNIFLALGVKGLVVALGILGVATMWAAVFADVGVALLAVLNSTRTLSYARKVD